jgi:hypothetical protein
MIQSERRNTQTMIVIGGASITQRVLVAINVFLQQTGVLPHRNVAGLASVVKLQPDGNSQHQDDRERKRNHFSWKEGGEWEGDMFFRKVGKRDKRKKRRPLSQV